MKFSLVVRRTHMYLALFLAPWMLMYALSTMAMNHRRFFEQKYGGPPAVYEKERELTYAGTLPPNATPQIVAGQILTYVGLEGTHNVRASRNNSEYTIIRNDPITPRRITFHAADGRLTVERLLFRTPVFLEGLHRRRGYQPRMSLENGWAFSVDLVIIAMVFWVASGLWMWWELKVTRKWGAVFAAGGLALFTFFLVTI